jgi:hypothetical protein
MLALGMDLIEAGSAPYPQTTPWGNPALSTSRSNHPEVQHKMNICQQKENECGAHMLCSKKESRTKCHCSMYSVGLCVDSKLNFEIPKTTLKETDHTTVSNNIIDIF